MALNFAVILSGCGYLDGSEIHESVLTLLALSKQEIRYQCYAPDRPQHHSINHLTQEEEVGARNVLVESARIARGNVRDLTKLDVKQYDAVIFPGGFGVAKNFFDYAFAGENATVQQDIENLLLAAHKNKIAIGAICISPTLLAKVFKDAGVEITVTSGTAENGNATIEKFGQNHSCVEANEICVDTANNIVSTPAYMNESSIADIATGIDNLVDKLATLAASNKQAA
jgi:enhancing lycopene biosynthesis protein 2